MNREVNPAGINEELFLALWDIDPEAAGYYAENRMNRSLNFEHYRVSGAFTWNATPQGHNYWRNLFKYRGEES